MGSPALDLSGDWAGRITGRRAPRVNMTDGEALVPGPHTFIDPELATVLVDRAMAMVDEQREEITKLRLERDILISTLGRFTQDDFVLHRKPVLKARPCERCGNDFTPRSGNVQRCDPCRVSVLEEKRKKRRVRKLGRTHQ